MYGGTKAELERLIADAASYTDIQKQMGITVDESSMSFDNIVNAIAVVQGHLGIAGATAEEAGSTIEGSLNSMKAAWDNLVTGIGNKNADLGDLIGKLIESASTFAQNLLPVIETAITGVVDTVASLAPQILEIIPGLLSELLPKAVDALSLIFSTVISILPSVIDTLINDVIPPLISAIEVVFNELVAALPSVLNILLEAFPTVLPLLVNTAISLITTLLSQIDKIILPIFEQMPTILMSVVDAVMENLPTIIESLISAIVALIPTYIDLLIKSYTEFLPQIIKGLISSIPALLEGIWLLCEELFKNLPEILIYLLIASNPIGMLFAIIYGLFKDEFDSFFSWIGEMLSNAWNGIVTFFTEKVPAFIAQFVEWIKGLPEKIAYYIGFAVGYFLSMPERIWTALLDIIEKFLEWRQNIIDKIKTELPKVIENIVSFFKELPGKIWNFLKDIITKFIEWRQNIIDKIKTEIPKVIKNFVEFFEGLPDKIKEVGKNIVKGLLAGIKNSWQWLKDNVGGLVSNFVSGFNDALGIHSPSRVFMRSGKYSAEGYGIGFLDEFANVQDEIDDALDFGDYETSVQSIDFGSNSVSSGSGGYGYGSDFVNVSVTIDENVNAMGLARELLPFLKIAEKEAFA